jgi:hypothetical protein
LSIFGFCDVCEKEAFLRRVAPTAAWPETFGCAECLGDDPGDYDEDDDDRECEFCGEEFSP